MDRLTREDLKKLIETRDSPCISLYTPTSDSVKDVRKPAITFKNQVKEARSALWNEGYSRTQIKEIISPAEELAEDIDFWYTADEGLAFFISPGFARFYRLPVIVEKEVIVSDRFHIKPLFSVFTGNDIFYILALSLKNVRLYRCDKYSIHEVSINDVPRSIDEVLQYDEAQREIQFHTGTGHRRGGDPGQRAAVFHGQGSGYDDKEKKIMDFFHIIQKEVTDNLEKTGAPLVLAGVEQTVALYRKINKYKNTLDKWVQGNPDAIDPQLLHQKAYPLVESVMLESLHKALGQYYNLVHNDKASHRIEDIIVSSYEGKVQYLFANAGYHTWGRFYPDRNEIEIHRENEEGDEDLVDLAIVYTIVNGGKVFVLNRDKTPEKVPIAAVYRY